MGARALLIALLSLVSFVAGAPHRAIAAGEVAVEIRNNEFAPAAVQIEPGTTVVWTLAEGSHTVTADDGSFRHTGMSLGQKVRHTFGDEGTFTYFCELHGARNGYPNGMTGIVYVGTSPADPLPETREVPSADYPTVQSALDGIPEGSTVLVDPGVYRIGREIQIESAGVTLEPSKAGTVVFEKDGGDANVGVVIAADDITLRRIEVRGFEKIGVAVDARRALIEDVVVVGSSGEHDHGIRVLSRGSADVNRAVVSGTDVAGVSVSGCRSDDPNGSCAYVMGGRVTGRGTGVSVTDTERVTVAGTALDVPGGIGISAQRSSRVLLTESTVTNASTGISVSGASRGVAVLGNRLVSTALGLHWDGMGVDVCFRRNIDGHGTEASSDPLLLQTLPCLAEYR